MDNVIENPDSISGTSSSIGIEKHTGLTDEVSNDTTLVRQLIRWINEHSSFTHTENDIPPVRHVSNKQLLGLAFNKKFSNTREPGTRKVMGLYNFEEGVIYLSHDTDLQTRTGKGVLLHELVHFLQYRYGHDKEISCVNELESLAYLLEAEYLTDDYHTYPLHRLKASQRSVCTG